MSLSVAAQEHTIKEDNCFRSEEEQISSLLDDSAPYPLLSNDNPVIFHNDAYERSLLMSFNIDLGESSSGGFSSEVKEEAWSSSSDMDHLSFHHSPAIYRSPTFTSGPLVKVEEPYAQNVHVSKIRRPHLENSINDVQCPPSKRGRPMKQTSSSKMANYARNYREMKKIQLVNAEVQLKELQEEVLLLREENRRMQSALSDANAEISQLRTVIDQDSSIASVVAHMSDRFSSPLRSASAGVCLHVGATGTTVEVCKMCADNSKHRLQEKHRLESIKLDSDVELFNGDFSSFEHLIS